MALDNNGYVFSLATEAALIWSKWSFFTLSASIICVCEQMKLVQKSK